MSDESRTWKIAGINFAHMHMGDLLRKAFEHPRARIVGICDEQPQRMQSAIANFNLPGDCVFTDYRACMEKTRPDLVVLCPATAEHAEWTERVAAFGSHVLVEKPFAASLAEADRMIAALAKTGKQLVINWPMRWYPIHCTAKRLIDQGTIGQVIEVHYYHGNRGPVYHLADKVKVSEAEAQAAKASSWFYHKSAGGGSLLDYLGYGTTLAAWFLDGKSPIDVTTSVDIPAGLEVDEHSVTVARYDTGLSVFETRWGTFTDPWILQPQPKCGFVLVGRAGTISSYDGDKTVRVQTREKPQGEDIPVDELKPPMRNPIEYVLDCLKRAPIEGPLAPTIARIGQQVVDSAMKSAQEKRTVPLVC